MRKQRDGVCQRRGHAVEEPRAFLSSRPPFDMMQTRVEAMALALQTKDDALQDLHNQLQVALAELERAKTREATWRRRAEVAEAGEEAFARQIGQLEADAFMKIMDVERTATKSMHDLQVRLQASEGVAKDRCMEFEAMLGPAMVKEACLSNRSLAADAAGEVLVTQLAELQVETYALLRKAGAMRLHAQESKAENESRVDAQVTQPTDRASEEAHRELHSMQRIVAPPISETRSFTAVRMIGEDSSSEGRSAMVGFSKEKVQASSSSINRNRHRF
ncbi:hypothetical protein KP509_12G023200 [Ceratopteris richardii]|nr:hypothetical protein KP509_12G023200 [Ceratopteris richardii]